MGSESETLEPLRFGRQVLIRKKECENNDTVEKETQIYDKMFGINFFIGFWLTHGNFFAYVSALDRNEVDFWNMERPRDMANIKSLEVMCGKTYMEVQVSFDKVFNGIIFCKGAVDQYNCIYVKPQTGSISYSFNIMYDQCGTKPDMNGKFYENNIVIQYDKDLIEVWDEAKRLRCEWYNDYEKGITKPPIRVSDLEVVELNFRGDNVDCWMEIQHGKGPWANIVNGIVPLGTTLTMVVGIKDKQGEFDMRVKSCSAYAKDSRPIHLTDEHGCVFRTKMISSFMKIAGSDSPAKVLEERSEYPSIVIEKKLLAKKKNTVSKTYKEE